MYLSQQKNQKELADLAKKLADSERMAKHHIEGRDNLNSELQQAHGLLSALGVEEKTKEEEVYYRKPLTITTRIALYIAQHVR